MSLTYVRDKCQHRHILPSGFPLSIVCTDELNFRVRDGNGWTLIVKDTDFFVKDKEKRTGELGL